MKGDQFGEQIEHSDSLWRLQYRRTRIDSTQRSEKSAVRKHDGHRDIALEAVHRGGRMSAIDLVLCSMVDDNGFAASPDFVANRRFNLQLSARLKAELDFIAHAACDPTIVGDPCYGREPHAGRPAYDLEDRRHRCDAIDGGSIGFKVVRHLYLPSSMPS